jgi:coronin-1B/1C/6
MAAMADRFSDKEEAESSKAVSHDEFDQVPRPIQRHTSVVANKQEEKTGLRTPPHVHSQVQAQSPARTTSAPAPEPVTESKTIDRSPIADTSRPTSTSSDTPTTASGAARGAAEGIKGALSEIRGMLVQQAQDMVAQAERIEHLTKEVAGLKSRLGE